MRRLHSDKKKLSELRLTARACTIQLQTIGARAFGETNVRNRLLNHNMMF